MALWFLTRETQSLSEDEIRIIPGDIGRHFRRSAQALVDGVGVAGAQLAEHRASGVPREAHHGMGAHHGRAHSVQRLLVPRRSGRSATNSCWKRWASKSRGALGCGSWRAISTLIARSLGNMPHLRDCQECWSSQLHPPSDMEHRFDALTTLWYTAQWRARSWKCACLRTQESAHITGPDEAETFTQRVGRKGCKRSRGLCQHPSLAAYVNLVAGISSRRRAWTIGGHGSCKAPNKKSWEAVMSWERRRRPAWVRRDG